MYVCVHMGFPGGSVVKNLPANARDVGSIPRLGRSPGRGNSNPLQCSCWDNPIDRGPWWATVHGVTKSWTWLSTRAFMCVYLCMCVCIYIFLTLVKKTVTNLFSLKWLKSLVVHFLGTDSGYDSLHPSSYESLIHPNFFSFQLYRDLIDIQHL